MNLLRMTLALLLMLERAWKHEAVERFFRQPRPAPLHTPPFVTIVQPVLSGDPTLRESLARTVAMRSDVPFEVIWVADEDDAEAQRICRELAARYPLCLTRLLRTPPPRQAENPKMVKVIAGLRAARGDVFCILDDDTRLPDGALDLVLPYLKRPGVGLAFGLPYYTSFATFWSQLVSYFVNSHSLMTYLPYLALTAPFTINGMFYALSRDVYERLGGFEPILGVFADDFAVAHHVRRHGYILAQTPLLHGISTTVRSPQRYFSLFQRWFAAPRESMLRHLSRRERAIIYGVGFLPSVGPLALVLSLLVRPRRALAWLAALYFGYSYAIYARLNWKYLRRVSPWRRSWLVPVIQLTFPLHLLVTLLAPQRVNWRGKVARIERGGAFHYLKDTRAR